MIVLWLSTSLLVLVLYTLSRSERFMEWPPVHRVVHLLGENPRHPVYKIGESL